MAVPLKTTFSFVAYLNSVQYSESDYAEGPNVIVETWLIKMKDEVGEFGGVIPASRWVVCAAESQIKNLIFEDVFPEYAMEYPDWYATSRSPVPDVPHTGSWFTTARCTNISYQQNKDGSLTAEFTFSTRRKASPITSHDATTITYFPPVVEFISGTREMEMFRTDSTGTPMTAPSASLDESAADIAGKAMVAGSKQGVVIHVPQMKLRIRRVVDVHENGSIKDIVTTFAPIAGKRNETAFYGFTIGALVSDGFNVAKLEGSNYEMIFDFTWDEYFEHSQVPVNEPDGIPKQNGTGTEYSDVRWRRPKRAYWDYRNIFFLGITYTHDADYLLIAEQGYWVP